MFKHNCFNTVLIWFSLSACCITPQLLSQELGRRSGSLPAAEEEFLGEQPPSFKLFGYYVVSDDGQRFAVGAVSNEHKSLILVDGKAGPQFESCYPTAFSPDSRHVAYAATRGQGKWLMVLDGKEGPEFKGLDKPVFSPDSQHLAYAATHGGYKSVVVLDGKEGPGFFGLGTLVFSPDSQHFAYAATRGEGKFLMVMDGKQVQEYRDIRDPMFSPDSQHIGYRASPGHDKWVMVLDGHPGPAFDQVEPSWVFSPDGRRLAYAASRGERKWLMVLDGKEGPEFEGVGPLAFNPSTQQLVYVGRRGDKEWIEIDEKQGPQLTADRALVSMTSGGVWAHNELVFSLNGQHLGYVSVRADGVAVFLDGQQIAPHQMLLSEPVFSGDSQHVAYITWERSSLRVVVDGKIAKTLSVPEGTPLYTPSSTQAEARKDYLPLSEGIEGLLYPPLLAGFTAEFLKRKSVNFVEHLTFSPDGQRLAFVSGYGGRLFDGGENHLGLPLRHASH